MELDTRYLVSCPTTGVNTHRTHQLKEVPTVDQTIGQVHLANLMMGVQSATSIVSPPGTEVCLSILHSSGFTPGIWEPWAWLSAEVRLSDHLWWTAHHHLKMKASINSARDSSHFTYLGIKMKCYFGFLDVWIVDWQIE